MSRNNNIVEDGYRKYTINLNPKTGMYQATALGLRKLVLPTLEELKFMATVIDRQMNEGEYLNERSDG